MRSPAIDPGPALERLADALFPRRCWFCGDDAPVGSFCLRHRPPRAPSGPRCGRCAAALAPGVPDGERCPGCRRGPRRPPRVLALGDYGSDPGLRELLLALKHAGRADLAEPLGAALADRLASVETLIERRPVLVGVPLHPLRRLERGYDQGALLARRVGERLGLEALRGLRRGRASAPQGAPGVASRWANVRAAFVPRRRVLGRAVGHPVVLVDDVVTSGATARAAAAVLRGAGLEVWGVLALARAAPRRAR